MDAPPERPLKSDCCGSGCSPCVFDVYEALVEKYQRNVYAATSDLRHDLLSPVKYKPFELLDTAAVNEHTNLYVFRPVPSVAPSSVDGVLPYAPGQHVIMVNAKASPDKFDAGGSISRSYTPVSVARLAKNCELKLLVKLYPAGRMSVFIRELRPGDQVYLRGAYGEFEHRRDSKYLMVCAGTGFAPMWPIIETILADERDETLVRLCLACATFDGIVCRDEIARYAKYWNFAAVIYLSRESQVETRSRYGEDIRLGRITVDAFREHLVDGYRVLICGSPEFNRDMGDFAKQCGCRDVFVF